MNKFLLYGKNDLFDCIRYRLVQHYFHWNVSYTVVSEISKVDDILYSSPRNTQGRTYRL